MTQSRRNGTGFLFRIRCSLSVVLSVVFRLCLVLPFLIGPAAIAKSETTGDTDQDWDVDLDDLNNVRNNFGAVGPPDGTLPGDAFPYDGFVNIDDLNNTRKQIGSGPLVVGPAPATGAAIRVRPTVTTVNSVVDPLAVANWTPDGFGGALIATGQGEVFAIVDLMMNIDNVARPDAVGFGNVQFNVPVFGDLREGFGDFSLGWMRSEATANHDGDPETPDIIVFAENFDSATQRDLANIIAGLAPRSFGPAGIDPRRVLGQSEPFRLGWIAVTVNSDMAGATGNVEAVVKAFSTYDDALQLGRNDGDMNGGLVTLSVVALCPIGDTDCDGRIDIDDLNNVRNNFGAVGPADGTLSGDTFPYDGVVNIDDLNNVRNHFGTGGEIRPVPEPSTLLLMLFTVIVSASSGRSAAKLLRSEP